ncbi:hypothetical protein D3Z58_05045 [Clostridiaceae bacterium]|nr:hypothetical protein [Clostridiaceae bacterium]
MILQELYHLIGLQNEIIEKLRVICGEIHLGQMDEYLDKLMDGKTAAQSYEELKTVLAEDEDNLKMLYCQLECARRVFDRYQEKHIPKIVYIESMKCFTRFIEECKRKNGRMFFDRGWWTYRQLSMKIFRIGELEYELKEYEGEGVIGIHVPSDANLSKEAVDSSLKQANLFFHTYYGSYPYKKYTCNSWLLSPALKPLLSEKSNILSFQKRFEIIQEEKVDREYIEWLFQVPSNTDNESLPAETSLQKRVKELLLNGGTVGCAYGILNFL